MAKVYQSALFITLMLFFVQCKKDTDALDLLGLGKGEFTIAGKKFTGLCTGSPSSSLSNDADDVMISTDDGDFFTIYNLSTANKGTFNFSDFFTSSSTATSAVFALDNSSISIDNKTSGTVTKTGAKSFTFSGVVYDEVNKNQYTITGSGTYK